MIDLSPYMRPRRTLNLEDGVELLAEAQLALDAIGQKLALMRKIASQAADPSCDPVRRISLNLLFNKLKKEIDEWADCASGVIHLLNRKGEGLSPTKKTHN